MTFRRPAIALLALSIGATLSACSVAPSTPPTPGVETQSSNTSSSASPASDSTLVEAVEVIANYNSTLIHILSDHSVDASLLSPYATSEAVDEARADQDDMAKRGTRLVGSQQITESVLQDVDVQATHLTVLTCNEFGEVRVMRDGADVTPPDRPSRSTRQVTLVRENGRLLVERSVVWDGSGIC